MEMEFFVPPAEAEDWYRYWIEERLGWYLRYGLRESHLRVRPHDADELSHYSRGTSDIEYLFPIGWSELEGIANRGDFDLTQHSEHSGTKLEYVGPEGGERYVPWVIEPAGGVDRSLLAFLVDAYDEEVVADRERTVLRLHPQIAPVKAAVLPLVAKDEGMVAKARAPLRGAPRGLLVEYDEGGAIGRRYRRQDEIGTPFAFTIDEQTLEDDTVTIRDRDSLAQERLPLAQVRGRLADELRRDWKTPKPALARDVQEEVERGADDHLEDVADHETRRTAALEIVECLVEARAECVLDRLTVPADRPRARGRDERQDELLAGRVQLARGAVEAAEREALHLAVDSPTVERRLRRARVGKPSLAEPGCAQ